MTRGPSTDHAHLSIGEVLSLLQEEFPDVTISKIRFLESQGLLDPERTPSGYRKFYAGDIDRLRWILTQQRENFLPLKVIKDRLARRDAGLAEEPISGELDLTTDGAADGGADGTSTRDGAATGAAGAAGDTPAPIWMADAARAAATRTTATDSASPPAGSAAAAAAVGAGAGATGATGGKDTPPARASTASSAPGGNAGSSAAGPTAERRGGGERRGASPLDVGPTSVSLTRAELASASHLEPAMIEELEAFGLLEGRNVGADTYYDGDALVVAQKAAGFIAHGIEPRHLRMFKLTAEREAGFLEQVVMPMLKQRNPAGREQAIETLGELAALGQSLRAALLRHALRDHLT